MRASASRPRVEPRARGLWRALGGAACLLIGLLVIGAARADRPQQGQGVDAPLLDTAETLSELTHLAGALGGADAAQRTRAFDALRTLGGAASPAIAKRLDAIAQRGFDAGAARKAMSELRRAQSLEAPDANIDLARGVLPLLARDRGKGAVLAAELMALLRALEAQKSLEAAELITGKLWSLDAKLFREEAARTRAGLGVLMIPAFLRHRNHPRSHVRDYCEAGLAQLAVTSPGRAVQQDDVALLAAILTAYGDTLTFDAMPVIVSYLSDERLEVQKAAQHALARFGKNAIWQLRERYLNATGKDADPSFSHQRLRDELMRMFEAPKLEAFGAAMTHAEQALKEGRLEAAQEAADAALRVSPVSSQAARALPIYDALAQHFAARGELTRALHANSRALRFSQNDQDAAPRRAFSLFLEAELRLATGQVDLKSYQRALALNPQLSEAADALDELTGRRRERERSQRQIFGALAAALLFLAGVFVLRERRHAHRGGGSQVDETHAAPVSGEP